jgi:hypothetical protein
MIIVVETTLCRSVVSILQLRFMMIESYEGRLKQSLILYNNVNALLLTRNNSNIQAFNIAYYCIVVSTNALTHNHVKMRKEFGLLEFEFGSKPVIVTIRGQTETLTFSHAMTRVLFTPHL